MQPKGRPHPSGRPIRERRIKGRPMWRIPDVEPNVPRLRQEKRDLNCIGFVHFPVERQDESDM
jgi:hypothetical protein